MPTISLKIHIVKSNDIKTMQVRGAAGTASNETGGVALMQEKPITVPLEYYIWKPYINPFWAAQREGGRGTGRFPIAAPPLEVSKECGSSLGPAPDYELT